MFDGLSIASIHIASDKLLVSTEGTYEFNKPLPRSSARHSQSCEVCSLPVEGVLHFHKDKEDKWHYLCVQCVRGSADKPDLLWAIKRPVLDLESKPWPVYNPEELLAAPEEARQTSLYISKVKINGKEVESQLSLDDICEDDLSRDLNPLVYLRLARPLKDGATLQLVELDKIYGLSSSNGLTVRVTPDYCHSWRSDSLITKNQALYDTFKKALDEVANLDEGQRKKFKSKIEEFVAKKLKDTANPHEIKLKELKITEDTLKFPSQTLQELSEDCKRLHIGRYL